MEFEAFPKLPTNRKLLKHLEEETGLKELPRLVSIIRTEPNVHQIETNVTEVGHIKHCVHRGSYDRFMQGETVEISAFDKSGKKWSLNLKKQDGGCIFFHRTNLQNMIDVSTGIIADQNGEIVMEIWGFHGHPNASKTCFVFSTNLREQRA